MSSAYLKGTPLETVYTLFGVNGDKELCAKMTHIGLVYTVVVGLYSILKPSPYGRYSSPVWGPTINAKLAWLIQECMSCVFPVIIVLASPCIQLGNLPNAVALTLFALHYFQRSFIYPLTMSRESKPSPVVIVLAATIFTTYNGLLQGHHLANVHLVNDTNYMYTSVGTIIFLTGMAINVSHDQMLISLRKTSMERRSNNDASPRQSTHKYQIPRGGLFEFISGANYFGEIMEWIGLAVITRGYPQLIFAIFTAVFLGIRAMHHHRFYKDTFGPAYPAGRKAIVPFLI